MWVMVVVVGSSVGDGSGGGVGSSVGNGWGGGGDGRW